MASTKADNNRISWQYISDDGVTYAISAKKVYVDDPTDGSKYGADHATAANKRIPKDMTPRKVKCICNGQPDKWVVAYSTSATIWTTAATALTLDANGVDQTYATTSIKRGEKRRDTCRQAT